MFDSWKKSMRDAAGFTGITQEHLEKVAEEIRKTGETRITSSIFSRVCLNCGINPGNFMPEDLEALQALLDSEQAGSDS